MDENNSLVCSINRMGFEVISKQELVYFNESKPIHIVRGDTDITVPLHSKPAVVLQPFQTAQ